MEEKRHPFQGMHRIVWINGLLADKNPHRSKMETYSSSMKHKKIRKVRRFIPEGLGEGAVALEYGAGPS